MTHLESDCYILHRRPYRETSYLVDAFSAEWGKVSFVARGARQAKSVNKSLLQPLQRIQVSLYGRHELKNLREAEAVGKAISLSGKALFSAMYVNELLNRLLPNELPFPELFTHYQQCLQGLYDTELIEPQLRGFELMLLNELGYGVDLSCDWQTQEPIMADGFYHFLPEQGLQWVGTINRAGSSYAGQGILDMLAGVWNPLSMRTAKSIVRQALSPLLGNRPLKSKELFRRQHVR